MMCVFDCESVPDVELLREVYGYSGSDLEVCNMAFEHQEQISGSSFLPLPFHKIISIAAVFCDEFGRFIKVGNFTQDKDSHTEGEILRDFIGYINKKNPRLVSFNGRNFDLPAIMLRAMRYNIDAFGYFEIDNASANKNKWDNYRTRYTENFHIDLLDSITLFGAARGARLDVICKMLKIPGKFDVSGDDVYRLFYESNNTKTIDEYCQSDVLNTYWLFLKYQILQGKIGIEEYMNLLAIFLDKIPSDKSYSEIFKMYLQNEIDRL